MLLLPWQLGAPHHCYSECTYRTLIDGFSKISLHLLIDGRYHLACTALSSFKRIIKKNVNTDVPVQVRVLFLILVDLCRRTAGSQHPLPASQVGASNIIIRLHYIDGNYTVLPEVVEASLGPHMQV